MFARDKGSGPRERLLLSAVTAAFAITCVVAMCLATATRLRREAPQPSSSSLPLLAEPETLPLGTLEPGRTAEATVRVRNPGAKPVVVDRIESSCPCIRATPGTLHIGPGESAALTLRFDPSDEPDFRGALAVEYEGKTTDGTVALQGRVRVDVNCAPRSGSAFPPGNPPED